jgi:hypothetical protein
MMCRKTLNIFKAQVDWGGREGRTWEMTLKLNSRTDIEFEDLRKPVMDSKPS